MTPRELIADLQALGPMEPGELFYWLADRVEHARTQNGARLCDGTDFRAWLIELAQAVGTLAEVPARPKSSGVSELHPRATRQSWPQSFNPTCHRCGHIHEGDGECGIWMGKSAGFCRCQLEVSA